MRRNVIQQISRFGEEKERMSRRETKKTAIFAPMILIVFFLGLILFPTSQVRATGRDTAAATTDYRTKCALCHGPDGAGSAVGKSMRIPDLRSQVVQKKADSELAGIISSGKGAMP